MWSTSAGMASRPDETARYDPAADEPFESPPRATGNAREREGSGEHVDPMSVAVHSSVSVDRLVVSQACRPDTTATQVFSGRIRRWR